MSPPLPLPLPPPPPPLLPPLLPPLPLPLRPAPCCRCLCAAPCYSCWLAAQAAILVNAYVTFSCFCSPVVRILADLLPVGRVRRTAEVAGRAALVSGAEAGRGAPAVLHGLVLRGGRLYSDPALLALP